MLIRVSASLAVATLVIGCAAPGLAQARQAAPRPAGAAPVFASARAWDDLRTIVGHGPRPSGSAAIEHTRQYIEAELKKAGIGAREQAFTAETPLGPVKMANVIATIPGARPERIVLAGHYDTKLFREFRFVGASDGGSSTAMLLEFARALARRRNPYTIELLFLDGEEARLPDWGGTDHTYGSRHYVAAAKTDGSLATIKALILVDMVGDRHLNLRRETNSTTWLTDVLWTTARRLGLAESFLDERTAIEDDHVPFLQAGVAAVDLIDLDYPAWHTATDTLDQVSARSLQIVGDVVLAALPEIERHLLAGK